MKIKETLRKVVWKIKGYEEVGLAHYLIDVGVTCKYCGHLNKFVTKDSVARTTSICDNCGRKLVFRREIVNAIE